ncbi:MAG: YfiR family protein [Rickettsiales bacterium]
MNTNYFKHIKNIFLKITNSKLVITAFIIICLCQNALPSVLPKQKSYYELSAEILVNFIKLVEWSTNEEKKICIIENDPIMSYLKNMIKDKKNLILIQKYENDFLDECSVLYVGDNYEGYLNRLISRVKNKPILSISGQKNFAENNGIVQFLLRNNRVEFIINKKQMKLSTLKIDNLILQNSEIIQ